MGSFDFHRMMINIIMILPFLSGITSYVSMGFPPTIIIIIVTNIQPTVKVSCSAGYVRLSSQCWNVREFKELRTKNVLIVHFFINRSVILKYVLPPQLIPNWIYKDRTQNWNKVANYTVSIEGILCFDN